MFSRTKLNVAILAAMGGCLVAGDAFAQPAERIEITGSSIKRTVADEGALPLTVLRAEELKSSGVTTVEGIIQQLSFSQSSSVASNSIGSGTGGAAFANLRGLGTNKTLVLLNGRRMAPFAFGVNAVDLNSIPFAAIDRIEVLRDGASAIYGTDAIGGVINFITKNNYEGGSLQLSASRPTGVGGDKTSGSFTLGFGNLEKDKFNGWFSFDTSESKRIRALDREFSKTGIIPARGVNGNSPTTFPGNFVQVVGTQSITGNLTAPNCAPPLSRPNPANNGTTTNGCVFDFSATIDIVPDVKQETMIGKFNALLPGDHLASLEYLTTTNKNTSRVAQDPVANIVMQSTNPFYPRNYPGLINTTAPITVGWRMVPAGNRTNENLSNAERIVGDVRGLALGWDYVAGVFYTYSRAQDAAIDGYVNAPFVRAQVAAGNLNPFAEATPAQAAVIQQAKRTGIFTVAQGTSKGVDVRGSRELFAMAGGAAAMSLAGEVRNEHYRSDTNDDAVVSIPSAGRSIYHVGGDRKAYALAAELLLPVLKSLEVQLAARYDHYSDAGNTFNPKIGLRFQPIKALAFRASYNTGFKAPTLDDLYGPQSVTFAAGAVNDPLLCPNGTVNTQAGGVAARDCGAQVQVQNGGNPKLKPEKSKTFTAGIVFEPVKDFTLSMDYWDIRLKEQISAIDQISVLANPTLYGSKIIRCNTLPAAVQTELNRCGGLNANSNAIGYVVTLTDNLGQVNTSGIDLTAGYVLNAGNVGTFRMEYTGTWVNSYKYQNSPTDPLKENVGLYVDSSPVFRWQHTVNLGWRLGDYSTRLTVRNKSGYRDQNSPTTVVGGPSFYGDVKQYTLADLSLTGKLSKNFSLTVGATNLFDTDPPFSNQSTRSQRGYDPRYTDPTGRAYFVRAGLSY